MLAAGAGLAIVAANPSNNRPRAIGRGEVMVYHRVIAGSADETAIFLQQIRPKLQCGFGQARRFRRRPTDRRNYLMNLVEPGVTMATKPAPSGAGGSISRLRERRTHDIEPP